MKSKVLFLLVVLAATPIPAHAYIDPGSGSAIMGAIVGFFVAIGLALKTYWYKFKSLFTGTNKSEPPAESPAQTDE